MMNNQRILLPLFVLLILLCIGIIYYNSQKKNDNQTQNSNPTVLGIKNDKNNTISNDEYLKTVSNIRQPINKKIEDLIPKLKYSTLFQSEEIVNNANEIKGMIDQGLQKLSGLNISSDSKQTNDKQIESLNDLKDAVNALIAMEKTADKTEKQKQLELFNYKIEESNRAIQNNNSSTSNSNGSSDKNNSVNNSNLLQ